MTESHPDEDRRRSARDRARITTAAVTGIFAGIARAITGWIIERLTGG